MKHLIFFLLVCGLAGVANLAIAQQRIAPKDLQYLRAVDDSLGEYGGKVLDEPLPDDRLKADSIFTRMLVRALKVPYSFFFHFDSMQTAPVVYPDDSSFRLITWHYTLNEEDYRQRGVMQMKTPDGSLKIYPLYDISDYTDAPQDSIRTPQNWIGAVYYKIIQKKRNEEPVYTLLGYDEHNDKTTRKWMELLTFNKNSEPRWGGSFLVADSNSLRPLFKQRFLMEYKKGSSAKLNYDADEDLIIMDHLVSETNQAGNKASMVPGGDYEAFKWVNGNWLNEPKLFTQSLGDGNEPNPENILGSGGEIDENKLTQQSEKNMSKGKKQIEKSASTKPEKKKKQ